MILRQRVCHRGTQEAVVPVAAAVSVPPPALAWPVGRYGSGGRGLDPEGQGCMLTFGISMSSRESSNRAIRAQVAKPLFQVITISKPPELCRWLL